MKVFSSNLMSTLFVLIIHVVVITSQEIPEARRLVVIYDRWVDLSPEGRRQQDIHAKAMFETVASSFGLEIDYLQISMEDLYTHRVWGSKQVAGVISIGECSQNTAVLSTSRRSKMAALALSTDPCPKTLANSLTLPLYRVKIHRRYQCLAHVLRQWLTVSVQPAKISPSVRIPLLLSNSKLPSGEEDYHDEYLTCVGPDVLLDTDKIDPESAPPEMKLELGKRFLNGRKLTVATIHRPPFAILEKSGGAIIGAKGFCYEMLNSMAQKFNFTYNLLPPYDGNWGGLMPNGSFNGMVGMVQRKVVDLALASITITYIRERAIDFTHAFYEEPTAILIPAPKEQDNFFAFLSPFTWQVWLLTLMSVLVVGLSMWLLSTLGALPFLQPHTNCRNNVTLFQFLWECAFSLASQSNRMKQTEPVRVLNGFWLLMCEILIYTYTGNLIAFLTVPQMSNVIKSLEELASQREILWTYRSNSAHETLFASAPAPSTYHKIGQLLKERPDLFVTSDNGGVEAVLGGNIAFIKEKSWLDFAMERDYLSAKECRLYQVNYFFYSAGYGCVLQQDAVYLQLFNDEILRMMQTGLFTVWRQKYWPKPNECSSIRRSVSGPRALHLGNFLGLFFVYAVGLIISLVTFAMERIYHGFIVNK